MSAPNIEDASGKPAETGIFARARSATESFLEQERAQLPLWFAVAFGGGIAAWLSLPTPQQWTAFILGAVGFAVAGVAARGGRLGRVMFCAGLAMAFGCALIWWRSEAVSAPRLDRPQIAAFEAAVEKVEPRAAKGDLRLTLAPLGTDLPPRVRVSMPEDETSAGLGQGAIVRLRARL